LGLDGAVFPFLELVHGGLLVWWLAVTLGRGLF